MKPVIYTSIASEPEDVYTNQLQYDYSNNNIISGFCISMFVVFRKYLFRPLWFIINIYKKLLIISFIQVLEGLNSILTTFHAL